MSPPAGTIDLGELPRGEQPEILVRWPAAHRLRRWRGRPGWRLAGAAATTALVLAGTGTAGNPPQSALTLSFTVPATDYNVTYDEDHLYVVDGAIGPSQTHVTAYRLADGAVQWQAAVPGGVSWVTVWGGALLVVTYPEDSGIDQTTRLDQDTGEPLWTRSGWPSAELGDELLFSEPILDPEAPDGYYLTRLSAVEVATGDQAWSVEATRWDFDQWRPPSALVTLDDEGMLASYDLATGELTARAPTASLGTDEQPMDWGVRTIGSIALVTEQIGGETVINAYDVETLQQRWRLDGAIVDPTIMWPAPCGRLVCLNHSLDPPRAIDPDTGATVWTAEWVRAETRGGTYDVVDPALAEFAGYAVLTVSGHTGDASRWLIDTATGEPVLALRRWAPAGSYLPPSARPPGALVTRSGTDGTWIGRLRADLSGIDVLGLIESATLNEHGFGSYCLPSDVHIVCLTETLTGGTPARMDVSVWRLR